MSAPDPWAFQRWAFAVRTGSPARKAVFSYLAMTAGSETGRCEAKQASIAKAVECSERTVRDHLAGLEAHGLIARRAQFRDDRGRRGDEFLLLAPWVTEWPDGEAVINRKNLPVDGRSPGVPEPGAPEDSDTPPGVSSSPGKNGLLGTTSSEPLSKESESARDEIEHVEVPVARKPVPARPLTYRGKRVPDDIAFLADRLLTVFAEATGRARRSDPARKQVAAALMARPDVDAATWEAGVRAIVASPPSWWDGPPEVGHVFGERAADHTLSAATRQQRTPHKSWSGAGDLSRFDRPAGAAA